MRKYLSWGSAIFIAVVLSYSFLFYFLFKSFGIWNTVLCYIALSVVTLIVMYRICLHEKSFDEVPP
jgi:carbon starvation protein CstA